MDVGGLGLVVVLWLDNGYGIGSFLGLMRRMIYFYVVFYFHSFLCPEQGKYTYCTVKEGNSEGGAAANICCRRRPRRSGNAVCAA